MRSLTLEELRELAPGYVMGTLTADELTFFNASLTDPAIAAQLAPELAAHRAAMEFLASSEAVAPPPALKARLENRIAREQRASMSRADTAEMPIESSASPSVAANESAPPLLLMPTTASATPGSANRATRFTPARPQAPVVKRSAAAWVTSGVFALAMAASLFFAFNLKQQLGDVQEQLSREQSLARKQAERLAYRDSTVNTLTHAETDLVLVRLAPNDAKPHTMQVFWNQRTGEAVLHASAFDQVPKNRAYCLWLIRNGKPEKVALFTPDADGHRLINGVALPRDVQGVTAMAVTEEPAEGSPQPTMQPFLVGTVTNAIAPK